MHARNLALGAIIAGALLSSTACGGGAVTIRPASGSTVPTSDVTVSGQTTSNVVAGTKDGAGISVGPDGVRVGDGSGAGYSVGSDGSVTASDGQGNGFTAGPGGVSAQSSGTDTSDPALRGTAPDVVTFCAAAARYGKANLVAARNLTSSGDSEAFAATLVTLRETVAEMRRTGPPALGTDLETLASAVAAIDEAFVRNGRDVAALAGDGSIDGISAAGQGAFDRVDSAATGVCQ